MLAIFLLSASFALSSERVFKFPHSVESASKLFIGKKYVLNPLGEGPERPPDTDPLYRFDQFDCTTYVETVIALTLANSEEEFKTLMNRIRYQDSKISYVTRNHVVETQWMPNAIKHSLVTDVTTSLGIPFSTSPPMISLSTLVAEPHYSNRIPSETFFNLVKDKVTHQGILIRKDGKLWVRHASKLGKYKVFDMPALSFFKWHISRQKKEKVLNLGVQLFRVRK